MKILVDEMPKQPSDCPFCTMKRLNQTCLLSDIRCIFAKNNGGYPKPCKYLIALSESKGE